MRREEGRGGEGGGGEGGWPTTTQVLDAQAIYLQTAEKWNSKQKYIDFHALNFKRLLHIAERNGSRTGSRSGNVDIDFPLVTPRTLHT